jgi:acyl dehydratase
MTDPDSTIAGIASREVTVDEDAVAAFALATNDHNPRYQDGRAVPPLFTATVIMPAERESGDDEIVRSVVGTVGDSVHGQHDIHFRRPVQPGMVLRWRAAGISAHQTRSGVLTTQRIVVTDQVGEVLVEHLWSNFHIGGTVARDVGPALPDHTFPEAARERPVATRTIPIDRDQTFRYAGVSGDHVGHAVSDAVARSEGYPRKILQGLCTFAMASGAVVDMVAGGDPTRLRRLAVRFARPTFPRSDLEVSVYDVGRTHDGSTLFAFEGVQNGITVLRHGRFETTAS